MANGFPSNAAPTLRLPEGRAPLRAPASERPGTRLAVPLRSLLPVAIFAALALLPAPSAAEDEEAPARRAGLIFEGSFEGPEIARHPEDARLTLLVPFYEWDYGVRPFTKEKWEAEGLTWERIVQIATGVADEVVDAMEVEYIRDGRLVIECAIARSRDPFLTSAVLSPKFPAYFRETLGERLQVVILDRYELYVFPAAGSALADYGPALVEQFAETNFPVSLEVFLVDSEGARVIGEISRER